MGQGSGEGGASRLRPSHTTVRTGPYTAVREVGLTRAEQGWETERFEVGIGEWPAMGTPNHSTSKKTRPSSRLTGRGATASREPDSFTWIEKPGGSPPSTGIRRTN